MWGGLPDLFLKFEFQDDRSIKLELWGGGVEICVFPLLIQQLVATAQAVIESSCVTVELSVLKWSLRWMAAVMTQTQHSQTWDWRHSSTAGLICYMMTSMYVNLQLTGECVMCCDKLDHVVFYHGNCICNILWNCLYSMSYISEHSIWLTTFQQWV